MINVRCAGACEIVDIEQFHTFMFGEETNLFDMTSLGTFMLLSKFHCLSIIYKEYIVTKIVDEAESRTNSANYQDKNENPECYRLSLAYEGLNRIPTVILEELAPHIKILDISNNEFRWEPKCFKIY